MKDTAIDKIMKALLEENSSTEELGEKLDLPLGTVRSTLSTLKRVGLVEPVPREKRGTPFRLTIEGRDKAKKLANGQK